MRETVPDAVFDRADAVELVDLTPDDLIQRLKEGKVYVPKQAERALTNFFSPANLTALRELALRRTAERVDEQLLTEMQARAIPGPWAAGERILVCISEDPRAAGLVRYAKRLSDRLHGPGWRCTSRDGAACNLAKKSAIGLPIRCVSQRLSVARRYDPQVDQRHRRHVIGYSRSNNVTQIIIGKSTRSRWFEIMHGSVVHELVRRSGNISVHVIAGDAIAGDPVPKKTVRAAEGTEPLDLRPYLVSLVAIAVALGVGIVIQPWFGIENVDLVFLTAVVGVAVRYGLLASLFASIVASLCYNFFFLPQIYTFTITDPTNVAAFVLLHHHGRHRLQRGRAGAQTSRYGDDARAYH